MAYFEGKMAVFHGIIVATLVITHGTHLKMIDDDAICPSKTHFRLRKKNCELVLQFEVTL